MRVWIDVLTPKQALFFSPLRDLLIAKKHSVLITTRVYREAEQVLRFKHMPHRVVGRHGGATRLGKLLASGERIVELARVVDSWRPSVAVSFSSPEAARVAFGLGISHVAVNDSPHSWMVAKLTVPLSRFVCSPWIIKGSVWRAFGASRDALVPYRALDPAAWLKHFRPNPGVISQLGLEKKRPIIVLRTEEAFASYLMGKASDREPVVGPVISALLKPRLDVQIVVSTRYGLQAPVLRRRFGKRVTVLDRIVDATSLLSYSTFFIGSGGTMTVEAVLLGVPAISCFPGDRPLYIAYLERRGLIRTIRSPQQVAARVKDLLDHPEKSEAYRKKGKSLLAGMEDPSVKILKVVERAGVGS